MYICENTSALNSTGLESDTSFQGLPWNIEVKTQFQKFTVEEMQESPNTFSTVHKLRCIYMVGITLSKGNNYSSVITLMQGRKAVPIWLRNTLFNDHFRS
jgi:hypothetical protein